MHFSPNLNSRSCPNRLQRPRQKPVAYAWAESAAYGTGDEEVMKPTFIALLALCLCLGGCGKKEPVQPSASNTEATKPEPTKAKAVAGSKLWEFETGGPVYFSSPAIESDGTVYVGSWDFKLYAFKTESLGPAKSPWPMRGQNARHTGRVMKK